VRSLTRTDQQTAGHNSEYDPDNRLVARLNPSCFACGSENPRGLHLEFDFAPAGAVSSEWIPAENLESFQGVIHGGIVATVLDEAMSKAVIARHWEALTTELRVRFRRSVFPGEVLCVAAWVVGRRKRRILAEATMRTLAGEERAHAWATLLLVSGGIRLQANPA
jgi:acyl-coenzyme A thioesterase PaaI-like protein